ncbi:MAG TPA: sigma-70 family RNA polymerase sigma factor [Armatimonadota bacterium]|nr:sigma-70 family RNA polymerase sigma factor [Armatimonadota bacterium]
MPGRQQDSGYFDEFSPTGVVTSEALWEAGLRAARHAGVTADRVEDCASGFANAHLNWLGKPFGARGGCKSIAYFLASAKNAATDFRKHEESIARHEAPYPMVSGEDGTSHEWEPADAREGPAAALRRRRFWREVEAAAAGLTPRSQKLFRARFVENATIPELASQFGITEEAVRKSLRRINHRMRLLMRRRGLTSEEVCAEVAALLRSQE